MHVCHVPNCQESYMAAVRLTLAKYEAEAVYDFAQ